MKLIIFLIAFILSSHHPVFIPDVLFAPDYFVFPDYGFEQSDSEKFAPILNLIRTGAFKIEEFESGYSDGRFESEGEPFRIFKLTVHGDSVLLDRYYVDKDTELVRNIVFSLKGKVLYDHTSRHSSSGEFRKVFDSATKSFFEYRPNMLSYLLHTKDSSYLARIMKYDNQERLSEETEFDEFGKIKSQTFFHHDGTGRDTVFNYRRSNQPDVPSSPDSIKIARWVEYYLQLKEEVQLTGKIVNKIDSVAKTQEEYYYDYDNGDSTLWGHSITYYDHLHREIRKEQFPGTNGIKSSEVTKYIDDAGGRLLSKNIYRNDALRSSDTWNYDRMGRCIMHLEDNQLPNNAHRRTWSYDSKGNIIESVESWGREPAHRNRFKIYYK